MLPISFHLSFSPERRYLASMLDYAALGRQGSFSEISDATGIPTGRSTGKVPAILGYAQGMGLIEVVGEGSKMPILTDFGRAVYYQDRYLGEELTQWLVHFNLCRNDIGAVAWNSVFARGMLGASFTRAQLEEYLVGLFGKKAKIGPMLVTYSDDAALSRAGVLKVEGDSILRNKAPLLRSYARAYSAHLLSLLEVFFPSAVQVTATDFNDATRWFDVCFWKEPEVETALTMLEETGNISVDKHMRPWIIEKRRRSAEVWPTAWDDLA
ncbi:MAG: DUF4007 family protein [Limnochordia bacterium]